MPNFLGHPLRQAIFVSLLLHGLLLLNFVAPTVPVRLETPALRLNAVLNSPVTALPTAKPVQNSMLKPPPLRHAAAKSPEKAVVPLLVVPQAVPDVVAPEGRSALSSKPSDEPHSTPAEKPSRLPASVVVLASNPGISADDLRQYRLSLAIAARRFKRYPALARERGWQGTADVALNFSALLPAPQISLTHSSGSPQLDEQALDMVSQAARTTFLPESLKGRDLHILLPVRFSLEEI